jgi:isopropylmalate/homocitrate/citramalate synthase
MKSEEDGQPQVDPQVQQQMQQMADMVEHLSQELKAAQAKAESDEDKLDIERFKAQTDRMKVIAELEQKGALTDAQLHQLALANLQSTLALGNTGEAEEINEESEPMAQQPAEQSVQSPTEGQV